ncbi:ABC transporter ATP-binding protein [Bordetella genomosp. 11]|uniref:Dipeptide ABC transporter ATP-binding protein DppD n=1 Tax=Bordetella genomosp. 11 TaxID=1416808 RepID=A0A261V079_9BORD|nr:ABC transporter ATP-binding protein [Bordetella genomosp. 11]OZI66563.1 dipeptide ABC transporter ATP-binding protein DppD [Bordetella genomosp. 11]
MTRQALIRARDLHVSFVSRDATVAAVNGIDLDLNEGQVLCVLGESGSGKSVTLRALMRLNPRSKTVMRGELTVAGHDMMALPESSLPDVRGKVVSMIFQEPMTALDPVFPIGRQIVETIVRHEGLSKAEARQRTLDLLDLVQIPSARMRLNAYPHELSGGLRQRAMIAMAISCRPRLLLADEPTTALDATVQIQVLLLLRSLQEELGMGVVFVTHDLGVAGEIADRVAVMYAGRIVEQGSVSSLLTQPLHPYTQGLLGATVQPGKRGERLTTIPGAPPDLRKPMPGCAFAPRCPRADEACRAAVPEFHYPAPGRAVRCIKVMEAARAP